MKIEHIALWVKDLEGMREFYMKYFGMLSNELYVNKQKQFSSYFLSFPDSDCRIELMHNPDIVEELAQEFGQGLTHFAIALESKEKVDELTEHLRINGYKIIGEARTTGDGYYESAVLDLEGNKVEITCPK